MLRQVLVVVACFSFLLEMSTSMPCSTPECYLVMQPRLRRSRAPYKRHDEYDLGKKSGYDYVRFGKRSNAEKKAAYDGFLKRSGYDYVRFGKRSNSEKKSLYNEYGSV